jgi:large subunit ribosomal protein L22
MGRFSYAFQDFDKTKHVRAAIREKGISHKHAREIGISIKGLSIEKSRDYLLGTKYSFQTLQKSSWS